VQREVARRYAAGPWGPESPRSLKLKVRWQIEVARWLRPRDFDPPPSVESAWLWLARRPRPLIDGSQQRRYEDFVDTTFRRGSSIKGAMREFATYTQVERLARDLGFQLRARPSDLHFDQWLALFRFVQGGGR
jgi:23S rRNA (adenine-N6)-dimethyltransferase